jgi:hypothetical protein
MEKDVPERQDKRPGQLSRELGALLRQYREEAVPTPDEIALREYRLKDKPTLFVDELTARLDRLEMDPVIAGSIKDIEEGRLHLSAKEFNIYIGALTSDPEKIRAASELYEVITNAHAKAFHAQKAAEADRKPFRFGRG